jgi:hypothetical protein
MSIGKQFIRIGEFTAALGLWGIVIWLFSKPKRILISICALFIIIFSFNLMLDDSGETFYVNVNSLELLDKPFGSVKKTLEMNDSLTLIKEMSDNWLEIKAGADTFYFAENFYDDSDLGYVYKIQKTPFTKWKALQGQKIELNHPNGFFEADGTILKNGDIITVMDYSETDKQIKFKNGGGSFTEIPLEYLKINWNEILKKYPKIQ